MDYLVLLYKMGWLNRALSRIPYSIAGYYSLCYYAMNFYERELQLLHSAR